MDKILSYSFDLGSHLTKDSDLIAVSESSLETFSQLLAVKESGDNILLTIVNVADLGQTGWNLCKDIYEDIGLDVPVLITVRNATESLTSGQELLQNSDYFEDFIVEDINSFELEMRIKKILKRFGKQISKTLITYGPIVINTDTYQVLCDNRPLDLAYMEYELLKFLVSKPGKVFSRQSLLSRVWGYEYYGGARTVDVHIRRLRAKLGEEHANLVQTVRSVGYRFGLSKY
jgi:DNA-binding response OmpR family regulator